MFRKVMIISAVLALAVSLGAHFAISATDTKTEKPSYAKQLVAKCKKTNQPVTMDQAKTLLAKSGHIFIDVRTEKEFKKGHLPGSINIPRGKLEFVIEKKVPDYKAKIVIYCKSGGRAALAACTLRDMGYSNVIAMNQGFDQWAKASLPVE